MNIRHIRLRLRAVTGLSWCTVSLLGGGTGISLASTYQSAPHLYQTALARGDTASRSDTTVSAGKQSAGVAVDPEVPPSTKWNPDGWTGRVVVGEYLTGVFCGGCQAHEHAFDAVLQRYPSTAVIALAYHGTVNFPIADPADSLWERLYDWYGSPGSKKVPNGLFPQEHGWDNWIDGHATAEGSIVIGQDEAMQPSHQYEMMVKAIDAELHKAPEARLQVQATPKGGTVVTHVKVDSLSPSHQDVYVRVLLVEDTVFLTKPKVNGTPRLNHYMVVRGVAHNAKFSLGLPLHGAGSVAYTFDVAKSQQRMLKYRTLGVASVPGMSAKNTELADEVKQIISVFPDERDWLIDPTRLHIVAFVQDAHTGDVLQSQMIAVNAGPRGKLLKLR